MNSIPLIKPNPSNDSEKPSFSNQSVPLATFQKLSNHTQSEVVAIEIQSKKMTRNAKNRSKYKVKQKKKAEDDRKKINEEVTQFIDSLRSLGGWEKKNLTEIKVEPPKKDDVKVASKSSIIRKKLREKKERKALEQYGGRSKDQREIIAKQNRTLIFSSLSTEEKILFDEITSIRDCRLGLCEYFGMYIYKIIKKIEIKDPDKKSSLDTAKDEFFDLFFKFSGSWYGNLYSTTVDHTRKFNANQNNQTLKSVFSMAFPTKKELLEKANALKNTLVKDEVNSANIVKLEKVFLLLKKILSEEGKLEVFGTVTVGFFEGETIIKEGELQSVLGELIDFLDYKRYLFEFSGLQYTNLQTLHKTFLIVLAKLSKSPLSALKADFLGVSDRFNEVGQNICLENEKRKVVMAIKKGSDEGENSLDTSSHLIIVYTDLYILTLRHAIEMFEERLIPKIYPKFLSKTGYCERIISNLSQITTLEPKLFTPTETSMNEKPFSDLMALMDQDLRELFVQKKDFLKTQKNLNYALENTFKYGGAEALAISLIPKLLKSEIDSLPEVLKEIQKLHQKYLEKFKELCAAQPLEEMQIEILINKMKEVALHSSLPIAQYILILTDSKIVLNLDKDPDPLKNCEKRSTPQELIDFIALDGIDDLIPVREQTNDSQENIDEKKEKADDLSSIEKEWERLASASVSKVISIRYPSQGTCFDGVTRKATSLEIARNEKNRKIRRALRILGFYSRSGRGSHTVYSINGGGSIAVPLNPARGTMLAIQNAANQMIGI